MTVQANGLALPRARAARREIRRDVRRRLVKRAVDGLFAAMLTTLAEGRRDGVLSALCLAALLRPVSIVRLRTVRRLMMAAR